MKKKMSIFLVFTILFSAIVSLYPNIGNAIKETVDVSINGNIENYQRVNITLDEKKIVSDVPGILYKGTTMVPIRLISENLGAEVNWSQDSQKVEVKKSGKTIVINIGSNIGYIDGVAKNITGGNPPILASSTTLVPIRFLSEELGFTVNWDGVTNTAMLSSINNDYKLMQYNKDIGSYSTLSRAVLEGVKWEDSSVEKDGRSVWNYNSHMKSYVLYQGYTYLGMYDSISEAVSEAVKWDNTTIENNGEVVWEISGYKRSYNLYQNKDYIKSFSNLDSATAEGKKLENSRVEKDGKSVWSIDIAETGYKVYQDTIFLGVFASLSESITEAAKWSNSFVIKDGETVWKLSKNKVIVIDPGHGGKDPGAVSFSGYAEKNLALSVSLKLGEELTRRGYTVKYTRTNDVYLSLSQRASIGNNANADGFISVHYNSASAKTATGIETYYAPSGGVKETFDYNFANAIQKRLISATGQYNRGTKSANFTVIKESRKYASLVELGFISNPMDEAELVSDSYHNKVAIAIANGIDDFYQ